MENKFNKENLENLVKDFGPDIASGKLISEFKDAMKENPIDKEKVAQIIQDRDKIFSGDIDAIKNIFKK